MALINETKGSLVGGVNQQAPEHRLSVQVEEMINCLPTLDKGLLRRNGTTNKQMTDQNDVELSVTNFDDAWYHELDTTSRGFNGSRFQFRIADGKLEIYDLNSNIVYSKDNGITFGAGTENYLFNGVTETRQAYSASAVKDSVFIVNRNVTPQMTSAIGSSAYKKQGSFWVKDVEPIDGSQYTLAIKLSNGQTQYKGITSGAAVGKKTSQVAAALLTNIQSWGDFELARMSGSMGSFRDTTNDIISVDCFDDYGNTYISGWAHSVDSITDLPKEVYDSDMGYTVTKVGTSDNASYWVHREEGKWKETRQPDINYQIDATTMPVHVKVIPSGDGKYTFSVETYSWDDRKVGDDTTNKLPNFIGEPIEDIHFFRNRLGLLTKSGISYSEIGEYGNFFRTSVSTLLDSDRIDTVINSTDSISLKHALVFEDSVILFSETKQFKFEGGTVLSPTEFKISELTAYAVNTDIRPLAVNDTLYFASTRGSHTAIYEMTIGNQSTRSSEAFDITAHCQSYIPADVQRLIASPVNSMLFVVPVSIEEPLFVYKFHKAGGTLHQSSWFKWNFNGDLYGASILGDKLSLWLDRLNVNDLESWVMGRGVWNMSEEWHMDGIWYMSEDSLVKIPSFEDLELSPNAYDRAEFLDKDGQPFTSFVNFGEWIAGEDGKKDTRGDLRFKTIEIVAEDDSEFGLWIRDKNRNSVRTIDHNYVKNRKPRVYGDAKNIETGIISESEAGFRISTVSFEGDLTRRSKSR